MGKSPALWSQGELRLRMDCSRPIKPAVTVGSSQRREETEPTGLFSPGSRNLGKLALHDFSVGVNGMDGTKKDLGGRLYCARCCAA